MHRSKLHLFDHLVGEQLHRTGNHEAKRLCSLEFEDKIEFRWLFHRNLANAATQPFQRTSPATRQNIASIGQERLNELGTKTGEFRVRD
jgi:bisphosphoglycerate-dependent phosphoglycerate mutase